MAGRKAKHKIYQYRQRRAVSTNNMPPAKETRNINRIDTRGSSRGLRRLFEYIWFDVRDDIVGNWLADLMSFLALLVIAGSFSLLDPAETTCRLFKVACAAQPALLTTETVATKMVVAPVPTLTPMLALTSSPAPTPEIVATPVPSPTPRCPNPNQPIPLHSEYRVEAGDCLSCIALRARISLQELLLANPHKDGDPDFVLPGEIIQIP